MSAKYHGPYPVSIGPKPVPYYCNLCSCYLGERSYLDLARGSGKEEICFDCKRVFHSILQYLYDQQGETYEMIYVSIKTTKNSKVQRFIDGLLKLNYIELRGLHYHLTEKGEDARRLQLFSPRLSAFRKLIFVDEKLKDK